MPGYTNIPKPTGANYTRITFQGKQTYNQSDIAYDASSVFYDTINEAAYALVAKPTGFSYIIAGMATGLIMPPTYSIGVIAGAPWINVSKPT